MSVIKILCLRKYKLFIITFCLISFISFNYRVQRANAVLPGVVVAGGVVVSYEALTVLAAATIIAGGAVANIDQNSKDLQAISDDLIATGNSAQYLATKISDTGQQFLTWTIDGFSWFNNQVSNLTDHIYVNSDGSYFCPFDSSNTAYSLITSLGTVTIPAGSQLVLTGSSWTYKLSNTGSTPYTYTIKSNQYYTSSIAIGFYTGDGSTFIGNMKTLSSTADHSFTTNLLFNTGLSSLATTYSPSVATDVWGGSNSSNTQSVDDYSYGIPLVNQTGSDVLSTDMAIPYGQSWGDISADLGITYPTGDVTIPGDGTTVPGDTTIGDTVGDTTGSLDSGTGVLNIPILGQILAALLKILSFLGTLISSLVDAIITALADALTVAETYFVDNFNDFENRLKDKFPVSLNGLDDLKNVSESNNDFVYNFTLFGVALKIDINFIKKIAPMTRGITSGIVAIWLCWYNYRKIYEVIRGNAPLGGDSSVSPTSPSTSLTIK